MLTPVFSSECEYHRGDPHFPRNSLGHTYHFLGGYLSILVVVDFLKKNGYHNPCKWSKEVVCKTFTFEDIRSMIKLVRRP